MASKVKPEIFDLLKKYTGLKGPSLSVKITRIKSKNPGLTGNAVAFLIAKEYGKSLLGRLNDEDKVSLRGYQPPTKVSPPIMINTQKKGRTVTDPKRKAIINYETNDYFVKEHIKELTKAYYATCYTCVFIFFRKIIENFISSILQAKFPNKPELVLDIHTGRYLDFSVILDNLYRARTSFSPDGKARIERINQLVKPFKEDANAKVHSWFHIVKSPTEIGHWQLDTIIELIKALEIEVGLRAKP